MKLKWAYDDLIIDGLINTSFQPLFNYMTMAHLFKLHDDAKSDFANVMMKKELVGDRDVLGDEMKASFNAHSQGFFQK